MLVLVAGVVLVVAAAALVLVAVLDDDEPTTPPPAAQPAGEVENPLGPPGGAPAEEPSSPPAPVESGGPAPDSTEGETVEVDFSGTMQLMAAFAQVGGMGGAAAYSYMRPGLGLDMCDQILWEDDSKCDAATELTSDQAQCLVLRDGIVAFWAVDEPTHIPNNKATFTAWFGSSWDEYVGIGTGSNAGEVVVTGGRVIGDQQWGIGGGGEGFVLTARIFDGFGFRAAWVKASWTGEAVENASGEKSEGSIDISCLFAFPG